MMTVVCSPIQQQANASLQRISSLKSGFVSSRGRVRLKSIFTSDVTPLAQYSSYGAAATFGQPHRLLCKASRSTDPVFSDDGRRGLYKRVAECVPAILGTAAAVAIAMTCGRAFAAATNVRATPANKLMRQSSMGLAGFLAGCVHSLAGPDHLAALAPLCIGRSKLESAAVGAVWGCGHDAGQVIIGLLFLLLRDRLDLTEVLQTWGIRVIASTLIIVGLLGIREAWLTTASAAAAASQSGEEAESSSIINNKKSLGLTFGTGLVYGLQPDVLAVIIPAVTMPSAAAAAFLAMFMVGTAASMSGFTLFMASCNEALQKKVPKLSQGLSWASSLFATGFGIFLLVKDLLYS